MCLILLLYHFFLPTIGEKIDIDVADASTIVPALLVTIQSDMFIKAKAGRDEKMATVLQWEDFVPALEKDCLVLTPFCDEAEWEEKVKVCYVLFLVLFIEGRCNFLVSNHHYYSTCNANCRCIEVTTVKLRRATQCNEMKYLVINIVNLFNASPSLFLQKMSRDEVLRGGEEEATTATSVAAKTLCKPFDQPALPEGTKCFVSGLPATTWVLWGRSY